MQRRGKTNLFFLRVTSGRDEEKAAVDASILDEAITHSSQFLAEEGRVLVLDVLNDRLPATTSENQSIMLISIIVKCQEYLLQALVQCNWCSPILVVDLVAVSGSIDNVKSQLDAILNDS